MLPANSHLGGGLPSAPGVLHQTHMNQGSPADGDFAKDNGAWQDGGLLLQFPSQKQWVAVFFESTPH